MSKKKIVIVIILVFIVIGLMNNAKKSRLQNSQEDTGFTVLQSGTYSMRHGLLEREYYLHVPDSYNGSTKTPLVVNLHGGGGSYKSAIDETQMNKKADEEGFIVAYPNSAKGLDGGNRWNNGPRPVEPRKQSLADDIGFLRNMIEGLEKDLNVDSSRIYVTGMSNGGAMTYRAACEMSDVFAAAAPVGAPRIITECSPLNSIPLLHIHGASDTLVPISGTPSAASVPKIVALKDSFPSVVDAVGLVRNANACNSKAEISYDIAGSVCRTYPGCRDNADVGYCIVADNGHTWPSGAYPADGPIYKAIVGELSNKFDTNKVIWDFFSKFSRE